MYKIKGMVEKWDTILGPWDPPRTPGPLEPSEFWDHWIPRTLGPPEISGLLWNPPETLKLKHKQKTSLNYITEQSEIKAENCVYLSEVALFIDLLTMIIRGKSFPLLPSNYATDINRTDNPGHQIGYTWGKKDSKSPHFVWIQENTDQKHLGIWTLFTQWNK